MVQRTSIRARVIVIVVVFFGVGVSPSRARASVVFDCLVVTLLGGTGITLLAGDWVRGKVHDRRAKHRGYRHIGFGIYYKLEDVLAALNEKQQEVVAARQSEPKGVIKLFQGLLSGDYKRHSHFLRFGIDYPERNAVEFLQGHSKDRGVCRHKAKILAAILNDLGIRAIFEESDSHAYVYIPELNLISDPTWNQLMDADLYLTLIQQWSL